VAANAFFVAAEFAHVAREAGFELSPALAVDTAWRVKSPRPDWVKNQLHNISGLQRSVGRALQVAPGLREVTSSVK
jgi:hypothetical protein